MNEGLVESLLALRRDPAVVVVDPGASHSIAVNRELLLGMVKTKGRGA